MIDRIVTHLDDFIPNWLNPETEVQYHIFILVTEGTVHYRLNGMLRSAAKGDVLFIPEGTRREAKNDPVGPHQKYTVTFHAGSDIRLPLLHGQKPEQLRTRAFDYFKEKFMLLHRYDLEHRDFAEIICAGILLEMLGQFNRELRCPKLPARKLHYVNVLEHYILQHYRETIQLSQLAHRIERSPNYTLSVFKEVTGRTPLQYQHRIRINAAMEMLRNTRLTMAEIADYLGYYDPSYFYKMFRRMTGLPPSVYAERSR